MHTAGIIFLIQARMGTAFIHCFESAYIKELREFLLSFVETSGAILLVN